MTLYTTPQYKQSVQLEMAKNRLVIQSYVKRWTPFSCTPRPICYFTLTFNTSGLYHYATSFYTGLQPKQLEMAKNRDNPIIHEKTDSIIISTRHLLPSITTGYNSNHLVLSIIDWSIGISALSMSCERRASGRR